MGNHEVGLQKTSIPTENKHTFELPPKHTPGNQKRAQKKKKKKKKKKHQAKNTKPDNNKVPNPRKKLQKKTDPSSTNDSKLRTSITYLLLLRFPLVSCNFAFRSWAPQILLHHRRRCYLHDSRCAARLGRGGAEEKKGRNLCPCAETRLQAQWLRGNRTLQYSKGAGGEGWEEGPAMVWLLYPRVSFIIETQFCENMKPSCWNSSLIICSLQFEQGVCHTMALSFKLKKYLQGKRRMM